MPDIPAGAKKPQDHLAPQTEVEGGGVVTIALGDAEFTVPADPEDLDAEFMKFAVDGDVYRMVYGAIGEKQGARLKALKPKIRDLKTLADQLADTYGFDSAGN